MEPNEPDRRGLCQLCGQPDTQPLPAEVERQYQRVRRLANRCGMRGPLPAWTLVFIGINAGLGAAKPCDDKPEGFAGLVKEGKVKKNDKIVVEWRGEVVEVKFKRIRSDGQVAFQVDSERNEQCVPADRAKAIDLEPAVA